MFPIRRQLFEQYVTPPEIVSEWISLAEGDITGKHVFDLCCGPGTLGLAALPYASKVSFLDIDRGALDQIPLPLSKPHELMCSYFRPVASDVVLCNPPFGMYIRKADTTCLRVACQSAPVVWFMSLDGSEMHLATIAKEEGFVLTQTKKFLFPLPDRVVEGVVSKHSVPVVVCRFAK